MIVKIFEKSCKWHPREDVYSIFEIDDKVVCVVLDGVTMEFLDYSKIKESPLKTFGEKLLNKFKENLKEDFDVLKALKIANEECISLGLKYCGAILTLEGNEYEGYYFGDSGIFHLKEKEFKFFTQKERFTLLGRKDFLKKVSFIKGRVKKREVLIVFTDGFLPYIQKIIKEGFREDILKKDLSSDDVTAIVFRF